MANKKETESSPVLTFTVEQICKSEKYNRFQDFLKGNLDGETKYSMQEVDNLLEKFMKGMVK